MSYHLDYETFSEVELKDVGAARYASDPSTRILMASISTDAEGPYLWVHPSCETPALRSDPRASAMLQMCAEDDEVIWAHNAPFEHFISRYRMKADMGLPPPHVTRWRCTAALARRAALPSSLEQCARTLKLTEQKDDAGKDLIRLFCKPNKAGERVMPHQHPDKFKLFGGYCLQDNRTERAIHQKLLPFELKGSMLETFLFDAELNNRGFPLNVEALKNAREILTEAMEDLTAQFRAITGLNPTQRAKVKALVESHDWPMPDMTADTIEAMLSNYASPPPPTVHRILEMYAKVQYAAARKVETMLDCVCDDGWVRGMLLYYGAGTGRWSGRLVQPHNFKKPTIKQADLAYEMIRQGYSREDLDMLWGNAVDVIASCIRNFIEWGDGDLWDADYNAIEARIVCWLADQHDVLEMYRKGRDLYKYMAARIYDCREEDIVNPSERRELGKRVILGCGFSMAWEKFQTTCWEQYGIRVSDELAQTAVTAYRALCHNVQELWYACDRAAKSAVLRPGTTFKAGSKLSFTVIQVSGIPFLAMRLPSGRKIVYPWPEVNEVFDKKRNRMRSELSFYGNVKGAIWGRVKTYGGKLVENATQGTAADVMAHGSINARKNGYRGILLVHDQKLALAEPHLGQTIEDFCAMLTNLPPWASGLPIKAEGKRVPYYKK